MAVHIRSAAVVIRLQAVEVGCGGGGWVGGLDNTPHLIGNDRSPVELSHSGGLLACHLSVFLLK